MSVYFIELGNYVKVGYSEDPERRFKRLFNSSTRGAAPWDCPKRLADRRLLGYVDGYAREEFAAHTSLTQFSVGCEFFLNEPGLRTYIDECLSAGRVIERHVARPEGDAPFVGQVRRDWTDEEERAAMRRLDDVLRGAA